MGGSRVCVWSSALITLPGSIWRQMTVLLTQLSSKISGIFALFLGSISSIRPMTWRLSLGNSRRILQGPLMTSLGLSPELEVVPAGAVCRTFSLSSALEKMSLCGTSLKALVDLFGGRTNFLGSCPGVGSAAKSLYELSVKRGTFQGNRRRLMQQ